MTEPRFLGPERDLVAEIRDELRLQAQLGKAEFRDQRGELEHKWNRLQAELDAARRTAAADADDVRASAEGLMKELRAGYEHLRSRFRGPLG